MCMASPHDFVSDSVLIHLQFISSLVTRVIQKVYVGYWYAFTTIPDDVKANQITYLRI